MDKDLMFQTSKLLFETNIKGKQFYNDIFSSFE